MDSTLAQRLAALATTHANQPALIEPARRMTYADLAHQTHRLAGFFQDRGIKANDRVALWLPNMIEWVTCFLALSKLGAITLSVNTRFRSHEIEDLVGRGKANWLIYWPDFKGIAFDKILSDVNPNVLTKLAGTITLEEIQQASELEWGEVADHGDHGALTFTTSGTTSLPKFVLHSQSAIIRHADAVAAAFNYDKQTRVLASAPFCGAFGFATLIGGLLTGHAVVCEPVSDPHSLRTLIKAEQVTHTYANNSLLLDIFKLPGDANDFESCCLFGFASFAPAMDELFALASANHVDLCGLYGSSELQALTAYQPNDPAEGDVTLLREPGGCLVHKDGKVRARDPESGHLLAYGQSGEIEILAPSHMSGYLDNPDATHAAFTEDGFFKTGDLGWCVSDQQFVFQARMGDSLRLGGFLVNPAEIEQVVEKLEGIEACQVVAVEQGMKTVAVAFVTLQANAISDPKQWQLACKSRLAGFKVPAHFEVLDEFPTIQSANSTKIQKHKLRDMANSIMGERQA